MAPKSGKRGKKKAGLTKRKDAIVKEMAKRKRMKGNDKLKEEDRKKKQLLKLAKSFVVPYHPKQKILLLGEADYSFAYALLNIWEKRHNLPGTGLLLATTYDSKDTTYSKYPSTARQNIKAIRKYERARVLTKVDSMNLDKRREAFSKIFDEMDLGTTPLFDRIIFNFPHLGTGEADKARSILLHKAFMRETLISCHKFLAKKGEIHITLKKGEPYRSWKLGEVAKMTDLFELKQVGVFLPSCYPGYAHRRTVGEAFKSPEEGGPQENATVGEEARSYIFTPIRKPLE